MGFWVSGAWGKRTIGKAEHGDARSPQTVASNRVVLVERLIRSKTSTLFACEVLFGAAWYSQVYDSRYR